MTMSGQELNIEKVSLTDTAAVDLEMQNLAMDYLQQSQTGAFVIDAKDLYRIEILAGDYEASIRAILSLRENADLNHGHPGYMPYELFAKAKIQESASGKGFNASYQDVFTQYFLLTK